MLLLHNRDQRMNNPSQVSQPASGSCAV